MFIPKKNIPFGLLKGIRAYRFCINYVNKSKAKAKPPKDQMNNIEDMSLLKNHKHIIL